MVNIAIADLNKFLVVALDRYQSTVSHRQHFERLFPSVVSYRVLHDQQPVSQHVVELIGQLPLESVAGGCFRISRISILDFRV